MVAQQRILTLAFLRSNPEDHWINRLTARVSAHPFCHVELFFESIGESFSVVWGETAGFRSKNLSNPNYELISLLVTQKEYDTSLEFCRTVSKHALRFDDHGMWLSWCAPANPCCGACDSSSSVKGITFCSKIITEALQFAGVREVETLRPSAATPSRLYSCVRHSTRMACSSVPFKRQAFIMLSSMH
jgi:hypothetical protein